MELEIIGCTAELACRDSAVQRPQHGAYTQVLKYMQSERAASQAVAGPSLCHSSLALKVRLCRHAFASSNSGCRLRVYWGALLQALLPTDIPAWAQACITQPGAAMGSSGHSSHSRQQTRTIWHGESAGELHVQASGAEECYWSAVQVCMVCGC